MCEISQKGNKVKTVRYLTNFKTSVRPFTYVLNHVFWCLVMGLKERNM